MIFFRHLTEWIFIFFDSETLNSRKLSKNPLSNFSEAGLAEMKKVTFFKKMLSKAFSLKIIDLSLF